MYGKPLRNDNCFLLIAFWSLLYASCILLIAFCYLLFANCFLLIAFCLLLILFASRNVEMRNYFFLITMLSSKQFPILIFDRHILANDRLYQKEKLISN